MILTAYFRTYAEHVTACKGGLCRPRRSRSEQQSHARRHTVGSDLNPTQKQILFAPQSNVTCKSMAQRHTPGCLYAYLTNCSPPSENPGAVKVFEDHRRGGIFGSFFKQTENIGALHKQRGWRVRRAKWQGGETTHP